MLVEKGARKIEVIAFGRSKIAQDYRVGDIVDVAGEMNINIYNGQSRAQIILEDMRLSGGGVPTRDDFVAAFKYLRSMGDIPECDIMHLARRMGEATNMVITQEKLENMVLVFEDVGLLEYSVRGDAIKIKLVPTEKGTKVNITSSQVYKEICENAI